MIESAATATDWGSVADWAGAVGSVGSVIAALIFAWHQGRRADKADAKARRSLIASELADDEILREAVAILAYIKSWANLALHAHANSGGIARRQRNAAEDWLTALTRAERDVGVIQTIPTGNVRIKLLLSRIQRRLSPRPQVDAFSLIMADHMQQLAAAAGVLEQEASALIAHPMHNPLHTPAEQT